jgi:lambda family phage tail tape measure protein
MEKFEKIVKIAGAAFEIYFGAKVLQMGVQAWKDLAFAIGIADVALAKIGTTAAVAGSILGKVTVALWMLFHSEDLNAGEDEQIKKLHKFQDALASLGDKGVEAFYKLTSEQQKSIRILVEQGTAIQDAINKVQGIPASGGTKPAVTAAWQGEINAIRARADAWTNLIDTQRAQYDLQTSQIGQSNQQTEVQKRITELALKYKDELIKINEEESKVVGPGAANAAKRAAYEQLKKTLAERYQVEVEGERKSGEDRQTALKNLSEYQSKIQTIAEAEKMRFELQRKLAEATLSPRQLADEDIRIKNQEKLNQLLREAGIKKFGEEDFAKGARLQETDEEYKKIKKDIDEATASQLDFQHSINKIQDSVSNGLIKSINTFVEDAGNMSKQVGSLFNNMTKGIEDAFVNFAKTGKMSMSSLFDTMLEDFIRMEIRMMESQVFKWLAGDISGGGTVGGGVASLFGLGKAAGGFVPAGQATLVGENGPELFTSPSGGQITPNGGTGFNSGGGGDVYHTHNYNIQAVDAKSVAQLFAENRMTMFGMVEQARRELPMRTR